MTFAVLTVVALVVPTAGMAVLAGRGEGPGVPRHQQPACPGGSLSALIPD
ncbi:hypothetical protein V6U90_13095 [Micromonospora sp. CPCC 206060]